MTDITATLVATKPVPIVVIEHNEPDPKWLKSLANTGQIESAIQDLLGFDYFASLMGAGCRGVAVGRLETILRAGVDVSPTDSVIWLDHLDKAVEYGSADGVVVMVFDERQLKPASREFPKSTSEEELTQIANEYPTRIDDYNGRTLLSRCGPHQDPGYGLLYGAWIPGDPFDALRLVRVIAPSGQNIPSAVGETVAKVAAKMAGGT
jgi:hypothetical protein